MTQVNFPRLVTIEDWAEALSHILEDAAAAVAATDAAGRLEAQRLLLDFIKQSPSKCDALDDIASKASQDLYAATVEQAVQAIAARNAELARAVALIQGVTVEAGKDAAEIQFERVMDLGERLTAAAKALKVVSSNAAKKQELGRRIEDVLNAVEALNKLSTAPPGRG